MKTRLVVISIFMILAGFLLQTWAGVVAYRMSLTIFTDKETEFVLMIDLDERAFKKIKNDPYTGIQPYLLEARKKCAEEAGYRKEIYGEENYKMVSIQSYSFVVRDITQGRVVFKK